MSPLIRVSQEEKDKLERIRRDLASRAGTSIGIGTRQALSEVLESHLVLMDPPYKDERESTITSIQGGFQVTQPPIRQIFVGATPAELSSEALLDFPDIRSLFSPSNSAIESDGRLDEGWLATEQLHESIKLQSEAIDVDNASEAAYIRRGLAYSQLGDHQRAVEDFTAAINLNESTERPYFFRGAVRARSGDDIGALKDILGALVRHCYSQRPREDGVVHRDIKPQNILLPETSAAAGTEVLVDRFIEALDQKRQPSNIVELYTPGTTDLPDLYELGLDLYDLIRGGGSVQHGVSPWIASRLSEASRREFERESRAKIPGKPVGRTPEMVQLIDEFFQEGLRRGIDLEVSQSRHGRYVSYPDGFLSLEVQETRNHALRLSVYGQPDQLLSTSNSEASSIPFDLKAERRSYTAFAVKSAEDVVAAWPLIEAGMELRMRKKGGRESTMQASLPQPIRDMPALSTLSLPTGFGRISVIGQIIKNVEPRTALIVTQYAALHVEYQQSLRSAFALPFETYATAKDGPDSPLKDRRDPFLICKAEDLRSGELGAMCDPHNQVDEGTELPRRSHFDLVVFDDYPSLDIPKGALHPQFARHLLLVGSRRDADLSKTGSGLRLERGIGIQASEESVDLQELAAWRSRFTWGGDGEI
jgi:tetratricopeptide (TPR) repeat protein